MGITPVSYHARMGAAAMRGTPFDRRRFHQCAVVIVSLLVAAIGVFAPSPAAAATTTAEIGASRLLVGTWKIWYDQNVTVTFSEGSPNAVVPQTYCEATPTLYRDITATGLWTYRMRQYPCNPAYSGSSPGRLTLNAEGNELRLSAAIDGAGTAVLWTRTHPGYRCANGTLTVEQVVRIANQAWESGAPREAVDDFIQDPCVSATLVAVVDDHQVIPDPGKNGGKNGKCEIAKDRVTGYIKLSGWQFEVGHATMTTSFCYDGKTVYNAGTDEAPHHATFQNPGATNSALLSCSYTGSLDNDFAYGWTDDTKRGFFTTGTIGFTCSGPALALAITAGPAQGGVQFNKNGNAYLTATQTVWQDGHSEFNMGGRP